MSRPNSEKLLIPMALSAVFSTFVGAYTGNFMAGLLAQIAALLVIAAIWGYKG